MYNPSYEDFCKKAKRAISSLYIEILADLETPVSAFSKIDDGRYSYLLESVEGGEKWGRYSFIGSSPFLVVRAMDGRFEIIRDGRTRSIETRENPLLLLKDLLKDYRPVEVDGLPLFLEGQLVICHTI